MSNTGQQVTTTARKCHILSGRDSCCKKVAETVDMLRVEEVVDTLKGKKRISSNKYAIREMTQHI